MRSTFAAVAMLLALMPLAASGQDHVLDETPTPQFLFVLSGTGGSVDGNILSFEGVSPVIYFSDRPARVAGHITATDFVARWDERDFADDPPNAVLSILEADGTENVVVELLQAGTDGNLVWFTVVVIEGTLPVGRFGPASLFVDPDTCTPVIGGSYSDCPP